MHVLWVTIDLWGKVGKFGVTGSIVMINVVNTWSVKSQRQALFNPVQRQVLLFCAKYPQMRFTADCILAYHDVDKSVVRREIQNRVAMGVVGEELSDNGKSFFYAKLGTIDRTLGQPVHNNN